MEKELTGKKLLILAGSAVHCKVVSAAKEMGIYTIVTDYLDDSPAKKLADESWMIDIMDIDAIVERCKLEQIDGVLNFCIDPAQIPYQKICEELNIPCYGNKEQFYTLTNKNAFKEFCEKCAIDVIPSYTVSDIINGKAEYPVFIKPVDSRGSRGQSICNNKEEAFHSMELAASESSNGEVIIEKYMGGKQDFSMTYFVCNGIPHLIRTCDRYLGRMEDKLDRQCIGCISPSLFSDKYKKNVDCRIKNLIRELGIKNGPIFMQGFIDGDTVRFYDPGLRFPGGEYESFLKNATGVDLMKYMIRFSLSGKMDWNETDELYKLNGCHSIQLDFTCRAGIIKKFKGIDVISDDKDVVSIFTRYNEGDTVPDSGDVRQRVCEVGILLNSDSSVSDKINWVQSQFDVLDENGKSMLISPLNAEALDY